MIISHRHRFVLLSPWKTASSTMHLRLMRFNESPYQGFYDFNPHLQRVVHQHLTYADFTALPESRLGYVTAAFVRNPYDRVYSGFLQLQRDIEAMPRLDFPTPWTKPLVMRQIAENFAQLAAAGFEFNTWVGLIQDHQVLEVGHNSSFPLHPAHYWTGIDGERRVDFVGHVERFERDFDRLCQRVGITPERRDNANVSDAPAAAGDPDTPRYLGHMTAATLSRINALFARDFEIFGFRRYGT